MAYVSTLGQMAGHCVPVQLTGGVTLPLLRKDRQLAVVGGHTENLRSLELLPPPAIPLGTENHDQLLRLLGYAGIYYQDANSPAADRGIEVFQTARDFVADRDDIDLVTFDWDHTVSNYLIFRDLVPMILAKMSKKRPNERISAAPMVAIESPRPFMQELVFGMMAGFAIRQGLRNFEEWKNYRPQVGLATHTWPDRIGVLGSYFIRLLPLMEGLLPGEEGMYEKLTAWNAGAFLNLHHYLSYADRLMKRFKENGFDGMSAGEKVEVLAYLTDGKAHHRKPLGAWAEKWNMARFLHFDDSSRVLADLGSRRNEGATGILVTNPWTEPGEDIGELGKVYIPGLWQSWPFPETAVSGVIRRLFSAELGGSTISAILGALEVFGDGEGTSDSGSLLVRNKIPAGAVLAVHETPTTVGKFRTNYVEPTNELKARIRAARRKHRTLIKRVRRVRSGQPTMS